MSCTRGDKASPTLGVLVSVAHHADDIVKNGELDVTVPLLLYGIDRSRLILSDVPRVRTGEREDQSG
jgi:hypothetical protein